MPSATPEMQLLDRWLATRAQKTDITATPLQRDGTAVRRARNAHRARAVERQLRWRSNARNRRQWNRYQRRLMRARRLVRKTAPTHDLQPTR